MPDWVANKAARLERIRAAKVALEAEAIRAHHLRYLLRLAEVINLGGKIQSPQCHARQQRP